MQDFSPYCAEGTIVHERMEHIADGIELRVISFTPSIINSNPVIIFVAGWITQIDAWKSVLQEMTKDFTVLYVETREKISSHIDGNAEYSIETIGNDIARLIEQWSFPPNGYVLVGSSLGATVIVECFHTLTKVPAALVLISPNAVFRVPMIWKMIIALFYPPFYIFLKPFVKWYLKHFRLDVKVDEAQYKKYSDALDAADPWKLKKAVIALEQYSIWHRLEALQCPVLLVGALKDLIHEPDHFQTIASMVPQVSVVDLETNANTHSPIVVVEIRKYFKKILSSSAL
jgi:pimeloyl-ACP methyl ester carboxylesterase